MLENFKRRIIFVFLILLFLAIGIEIQAAQIGEGQIFNVDSSYDLTGRLEITATLRKITSQIYFYIDDNWWNTLEASSQNEIIEALNKLTEEFEYKIYPSLTSTFGSEWKPGIDKDTRITILIHPMIKEAGGYFNSGDEYPRAQFPESNEREMVYLNSQYIDSSQVNSFLAHEFMHLITFYQKEKTYGVSEDVWLNEARSEYAPTYLGYDGEYEGSNLQKRVKNFLDKPYDSLTEWKNKPYDYGVVNLFTQYLVDHYGVRILADSLAVRQTGIESLNTTLSKLGFKENFSQIFTDWTIATFVNNCNLGEKYCYLNQNLKNFRVIPLINYLPLIGKSTLSVTNTTTNWAGNWHKFVGGKGELKVEFAGSPEVKFKIPYITQDSNGNYSIDFLNLDENGKGTIYISDFGGKFTSLTIIPSIQSKFSNFSEQEPSYQFFWSASIVEEGEQELIASLLAQIDNLKKEIARVQAQINAILGSRGQKISCQKFEEDLYFGMTENTQVRCLQEFLKAQGQEIYPEGLITGNFLSLTQIAVIRFQEKYVSEILAPLGLQKGTGYVGSATRTKINQLLSF